MAKKKPKSKQVAIREESNPALAFISMIERVASDPKADVSKVKELLAVRNEDLQRVAKQEYTRAMVAAQDGMLPVRKDIQADRFRYASYQAVDEVLRPLYNRHGFGLTFDAQPINGGKRILVTCDVLHRGGYERRYSVPMTPSNLGPKGNPVMTEIQAEGAAVSFGRRYLLLMIFNLVTTEDNIAHQPETANLVDERQMRVIRDRLKGPPAFKEDTFCAYLGIDALPNLPASRFDEALAEIDAKRKAMQ